MITSLHSSHVETVKALLGPRGSKQRHETGLYVIESLQNIKAALQVAAESIETLYFTQSGLEKLGNQDWSHVDTLEVSDEVMKAMTDTVTPQGLLAVARIPKLSLEDVLARVLATKSKPLKLAFFWEIQDPGNAGTVIRAADAFDFDVLIFSENSVDVYAPKVVRSSAGSLWNYPVIQGVSLESLLQHAKSNKFQVFATTAGAHLELQEAAKLASNNNSLWVFGNEARGIPVELLSNEIVQQVAIPISHRVESLNLATAASVVMYAVNTAAQ